MTAISKILVANRGEIALRIMRTAREMGISTVAIYSEADRHALHVRFADEAFCVGPPPSSESYLRMDKIIDTAIRAKADAIHPGYGFLSENEIFAQKVEDANLIFIGPSPSAMATMGNKIAAKKAAAAFGVPMVPGTREKITEVDTARQIAKEIGYPVLIKASAGGGGKGMRLVEDEGSLGEQMKRATSEALSAFGDGSVFLEKFIVRPRHVEFQVFGDHHGNIVHLFERECSIQRRHQKVVEEAPSPIMTDDLRKAMGDAAISVAKACNYHGAGTVEFILDENRNFYFLEMNTRLQVEHPVTELITGLDLVRLQILVAQGHPLPFRQEDITPSGHAIEIRVYAEDPANNFLPDIGTLQRYVRPQGAGIRVDDGFEQGMEMPYHYDPMIAKLICHAGTRDETISKMVRAIDEYIITGLETTLPFCRFVMNHPNFQNGNFDTKFVEEHFTPDLLKIPSQGDEDKVAAIMAAYLTDREHTSSQPSAQPVQQASLWRKNRTGF